MGDKEDDNNEDNGSSSGNSLPATSSNQTNEHESANNDGDDTQNLKKEKMQEALHLLTPPTITAAVDDPGSHTSDDDENDERSVKDDREGADAAANSTNVSSMSAHQGQQQEGCGSKEEKLGGGKVLVVDEKDVNADDGKSLDKVVGQLDKLEKKKSTAAEGQDSDTPSTMQLTSRAVTVGAVPVSAQNDVTARAGSFYYSNSVTASTHHNNDNLIVAELADDTAAELLLREREEENEALREELRRITEGTVAAEQVQTLGDDDDDVETGSVQSNHNGQVGRSPSGGKEYPDEVLKWKLKIGLAILVVLLVLVAIVVPLSLKLAEEKDDRWDNGAIRPLQTQAPTTTEPPMLQSGSVLRNIKENGYVRCRAESLDVEKGQGFSIDLCRALAAAVLRNASLVKFLDIPFAEQFQAVANGTVDVSTTMNTVNMERDVYHHESGVGFTFSDPFFYDGTTFAGQPKYVDCVDRRDTFQGDCRQLVVCVIANTVTKDVVDRVLPGSVTQLATSSEDLIRSFVDGDCQVMAASVLTIYEERIREFGYEGEYIFSSRGYWSYEPLAMMTREGDALWSDLVNWVLRAFVTAEHLNITHATAHEFQVGKSFNRVFESVTEGDPPAKIFQNAIRAVGNYGQLYERHFEAQISRSGMNRIVRLNDEKDNNNDYNRTGLLVADPLGNILIDENMLQAGALPGPTEHGTLEEVKQRGFLRCGVDKEREGVAEFNSNNGVWSGLDIEFCKAIAAAIFAGEGDWVVYERFDSRGESHGNLFNRSVDVLAGEHVHLGTDVMAKGTGQGVTFSPPYFFDNIKKRARAMVVRQDDPQWADLVRWVSQAPIFAESLSITQRNASLMPVVELFGTEFRQMFRDTIMAVGNYNEIYSRTLQPHVPRQGWNLLNSGNDPQFFPHSFFD